MFSRLFCGQVVKLKFGGRATGITITVIMITIIRITVIMIITHHNQIIRIIITISTRW